MGHSARYWHVMRNLLNIFYVLDELEPSAWVWKLYVLLLTCSYRNDWPRNVILDTVPHLWCLCWGHGPWALEIIIVIMRMANCGEVAWGMLIKEILALTHMQVSDKYRNIWLSFFVKISVKMYLSIWRNTTVSYWGDRLGALNHITSGHLHGHNVTNLVFEFCLCTFYISNGQ